MAYVHGFQNAVTGSIFPLVGTSTTLDAELDAFALGMHIAFGAPRVREGRLSIEWTEANRVAGAPVVTADDPLAPTENAAP
jgi:hypothetical protein